MAIPDNYIDKITKDGESRMISPAADKVRVDSEHYEGDNLDDVLDEIAEAIDEAGSGDGTVKGVKVGSTTYDPDSETGVVDLSTPIANKVDKVPGKGLSTNDYTDAERTKLQNLPTADGLTQQLSSKANAADVYNKSQVDTMVGGKQDTLQFEDTPTNGSTKMVKSGGIYTALQNLLSRISIVNGEWYIGETPTGVSAKGPKGDTANVEITDASEIVSILVNDLTTGGTSNIASAEMAKVLHDNMQLLVEKINELITNMAPIAFVGDKPALFREEDWMTQPIITAPSNNEAIHVGDLVGGATSVTKTIIVKGHNLTRPITVSVEGTGFSVSQQTLQAADLCTNAGVSITVTYTNNDAADGAKFIGSLSLESDEVSRSIEIYAGCWSADNIMYNGVWYEPKTSTGAYLHVGKLDSSMVSPMIDLGEDRSEGVDITFATGGGTSTKFGLVTYDANGGYTGLQAQSSAERVVTIPASVRFVRLVMSNTAEILAASFVKMGNIFLWDGSACSMSAVGTFEQFMAVSDYCPQPNQWGDYEGWVPCKANTALDITNGVGNGNGNSNQSMGVSSFSTITSMVTSVGSQAALQWVCGKIVTLPSTGNVRWNCGGKWTYSAQVLPIMQLYTIVDGVITSQGFGGFYDNTASNGDKESGIGSRTHSRIVCSQSVYDNTSKKAYIESVTSGNVVWSNNHLQSE